MASRSTAGSAAAVVVTLLLVGSAAMMQRLREVRYPTADSSADGLYITSGAALRHLTVGYNALAADLYWIRAIQYYGGKKLDLVAHGAQDSQTANGYPLLYPMLDLATTLDPRFNVAYRFGAIFLAEPFPGGAGRPDLAIALLEKGLRARADRWEYMQDAGFVHYWWRQDYKAAAEWFDRASKVPGAPWWLKSLAASTLAEGGDRRSSRLIWETIRDSAEIAWLRSDAERRLVQLQALDQIDSLQGTVDGASQRPLDWPTLVRNRIFPGVPLDPTGTPYELDARGRVQLSPTSALFPLPHEPQRSIPLP